MWRGDLQNSWKPAVGTISTRRWAAAQTRRSGELTFMASGGPEAFAGAWPALDAMAGKVYELGEDAGQGASFKIVNQLLAGVHIAAAC